MMFFWNPKGIRVHDSKPEVQLSQKGSAPGSYAYSCGQGMDGKVEGCMLITKTFQQDHEA